MPNLKIYVDATQPQAQAALSMALTDIRACIVQGLSVPVSACQLAVMPVGGLPDQPQINAEIFILPHPDRTPEMLRGFAAELQEKVIGISGLHAAVRVNSLDGDTFVALK